MGARDLAITIDRVDENDNVVGTVARSEVFAIGANFRVVHVFVFNEAGDLLLQKIAGGLRHSSQWGSSVAGYLRAGEGYDAAAHRKLRQELGLQEVRLADRGRTSMTDASCQKFIRLFETTWAGALTLNPDDAAGMEFLPLEAIREQHRQGARTFTATFLHVLDFYLRRQATHSR